MFLFKPKVSEPQIYFSKLSNHIRRLTIHQKISEPKVNPNQERPIGNIRTRDWKGYAYRARRTFLTSQRKQREPQQMSAHRGTFIFSHQHFWVLRIHRCSERPRNLPELFIQQTWSKQFNLEPSDSKDQCSSRADYAAFTESFVQTESRGEPSVQRRRAVVPPKSGKRRSEHVVMNKAQTTMQHRGSRLR